RSSVGSRTEGTKAWNVRNPPEIPSRRRNNCQRGRSRLGNNGEKQQFDSEGCSHLSTRNKREILPSQNHLHLSLFAVYRSAQLRKDANGNSFGQRQHSRRDPELFEGV